MAAPAITASTRSSFRGTGRVYWVPTIANQASPTTGELNAGTDLTTQVVDGSGFGQEADQIDTPDAATRFTSQIPGSIKVDSSSLTMYPSVNGVDARALMPQDTAGYIVIFPGGNITGRKMDVWPVRVASVKKQFSFDGSSADTMVFNFSATGQPSENVTVP